MKYIKYWHLLIPFGALTLGIAFVFYTGGIFWFRVAVDKCYKTDGYEININVWHNADIVASDYADKIPFDKVDSVEKAKRDWAKLIIQKLK